MVPVKNVSRRSKPTSSRRPAAPARRAKKTPPVRVMPAWMRCVLVVLVVLLFSAGFYWFCIHPYSYRWKPCYGMKGYGVCLPCTYDVHGIDISHYQGRVDWASLARNKTGRFPLCFIFMKATEGGDLADGVFAENFAAARDHGFLRGAYHYYVPSTDAVKQADFFIQNVRLEEGDLPPVLDVETVGRQSDAELQRGVKTWLDRVEHHYGIKPILYTSYKFKMRYLSDSLFNDYPYWIAHYYVDSVRYQGKWHFWQHTDVGTVSGIKEQVDLDVFNGSLEELMALTLRK